MGVAYVTLDNPPANSYDLDVMQEFAGRRRRGDRLRRRVVLVRSASEKFFSAGADVKKFLDGDVAANMEMIRTSQAAFQRMAAAEQVFVAHIDGHALGGGLEIALACDSALAAGALQARHAGGDARPAAGQRRHAAPHAAARPSRALDLLLTGRTFGPDEALRWGLVSALVDGRRAREYAERLAAGPRLAIAAIKRCVHEGGQLPLDDGLALEGELIERLFRSRDATRA